MPRDLVPRDLLRGISSWKHHGYGSYCVQSFIMAKEITYRKETLLMPEVSLHCCDSVLETQFLPQCPPADTPPLSPE